MSTHNICFCGEIRKISAIFGNETAPNPEKIFLFLHKNVYCGYLLEMAR